MTKRYTWKPDLPDVRDHVFKIAVPTPLPTHVDLRSHCSSVEDQGALGSCTGNAIAGALEYLELLFGKKSAINVSRLFIYYQERLIENTIKEDAGAMIRNGIKACANTGYCWESYWPYDIKKFAKKPGKAAYTNAAKNKITEYLRVSTLYDTLQALSKGFPVVFGFSVYESFETEAVASSGVVPLPTTNEQLLGGHAVLAVGYDMPTKRLIVRNSWGPDWGDNGYFTLPFEYITNRGLSDDFWIIRK